LTQKVHSLPAATAALLHTATPPANHLALLSMLQPIIGSSDL
jgi:hypothetical protein